MTREGHTTIGVRIETRDLLRWLSAATGQPMSEIVSELVQERALTVEAEAAEGVGRGTEAERGEQ